MPRQYARLKEPKRLSWASKWLPWRKVCLTEDGTFRDGTKVFILKIGISLGDGESLFLTGRELQECAAIVRKHDDGPLDLRTIGAQAGTFGRRRLTIPAWAIEPIKHLLANPDFT